MRFEFATSGRILFGPGAAAEVPGLAAGLGRRALLVTSSLERSAGLQDGLARVGVEDVLFLVEREPDVQLVEMATRKYRESDCELVIGLGGGSALDAGKAVAALAKNPGELIDYLEVVGRGRTLEKPSAPYLAVPTTAGTGSEATRNAVITVPGQRIKVSLRSPHMLPRLAVVDPELTHSLPPHLTATTGMDALTQLVEPFVCSSPTPLTDAVCRDGIGRAARSLRRAFMDGRDPAARQDMALASLFGGMALANARLGAVHGMANPIGGMCSAPHGAICARLLPLVMEANLRALRLRQPDSPALARYAELARLLTGKPNASPEQGTDWIGELCQALDIRPLAEYGLNAADFPALVEQSQRANSMKGNPVTLSDNELLDILDRAA
jgi:alcohol dehydrogenase class IV